MAVVIGKRRKMGRKRRRTSLRRRKR